MSKDSGIEWTDDSFNIAWGCSQISPGCANCYAKRDSKFRGHDVFGSSPRRIFGPKHWAEPLKWNREAEAADVRRRVFTSSMADVCEDHPVIAEEREKLWPLIKATKNLIWLLLTKRADRLPVCLPADWGDGYPNVALGVSVENQEWADKRIPYLLKMPARCRFLSIEPLLGPVDISEHLYCPKCGYTKRDCGIHLDHALCNGPGPRINWVIVGGESGPGARPMHPGWARGLRDQCVAAGVPFFFKQWGEWAPSYCGSTPTPDHLPSSAGFYFDTPHTPVKVWRFGKHAAGRLLDGREWNQTPWDGEGDAK